MAWGFRKSKKIAPGLRVTASKSGVSVTQRVGKTGIYHRTKLVGGKKKRKDTTESGSGKWFWIRLVLAIFFIYGAWGNRATSSPALVAGSIALGVVILFWPLIVWILGKIPAGRSEPVNDGPSNTVAPSAPKVEESSSFRFCLLTEADPSLQEYLHDLKIEREANGLKEKVELQDADGVIAFTLGGRYLGKPVEEAASWLLKHWENITGFENIVVAGGGVDPDGNAIPFTPIITVGLNKMMKCRNFTGYRLREVLEPYGCYTPPGDTVCYVSKGGKVHNDMCSAANLNNCTPMLVQEAYDAGYELCSKCNF